MPNSGYIELHRQFQELTRKEMDDPEALASWAESGFGSAIGWDEMLKYRRVLILAEGGSGKSEEMKFQAGKLVEDAKAGFYIPLENLSSSSTLEGAIELPGQAALFRSWIDSKDVPAWFFLDSVDELKLTATKFGLALSKFAKAIGDRLSDVRVVISSRPYDWQPVIDLGYIKDYLPVEEPVEIEKKKIPSSEEMFRWAIAGSNRPEQSEEEISPEEEPKKYRETTAVMLVPLGDQQIRTFAAGQRISDPDRFFAELERRGLKSLARNPLDLQEVADFWNSHGRLHTKSAHYEFNIAVRLKNPIDRKDVAHLSEEKARKGAELLALAMTLTKSRTLRSGKSALRGEDRANLLDPDDALPGWSVPERQSLLARGLFQPASYGRVRFHHRSILEYLAACRLKALREVGMPVKALLRFLFSERYGEKVLIPSMRPVTAWLAIWSEDVCRELLEREPELLLVEGDPESLPLPAKERILKRLVQMHGKGGWRGFAVKEEQIRRIADPRLSGLVRTLWSEGIQNDEVSGLLLKIVESAPLLDCMDLAIMAARDGNIPGAIRRQAIMALVGCHAETEVKAIVGEVVTSPSRWPELITNYIALVLFPRFVDAASVILLLRNKPISTTLRRHFGRKLRDGIEKLEPLSVEAVTLRDGLCGLILQGYPAKAHFYGDAKSEYEFLVSALASLCLKQLAARTIADPVIIDCSVVALALASNRAEITSDIGPLAAMIRSDPELRRLATLSGMRLSLERGDKGDSWGHFVSLDSIGITRGLELEDFDWIEKELSSGESGEVRSLLAHLLIRLWRASGNQVSYLARIQSSIAGDEVLEAILRPWTDEPKPDPRREEVERTIDRHRQEGIEAEERRKDSWDKWRDKILREPDEIFTGPKGEPDVGNLYKWLQRHVRSDGYCGLWKPEDIKHVFGEDFLLAATAAFRKFWRETSPLMWSDSEDGTPYAWAYGLTGVEVETADPSWPKHLSPREVELAVIYSTIEINRFAPFIHDLTRHFPEIVERLMGEELEAEIRKKGGKLTFLPGLQYLGHSDKILKSLISPRLFVILTTLEPVADAESCKYWCHNLRKIFELLRETCGEQEFVEIAAKCADRYSADPGGLLARSWLSGVCRFTPLQGCALLAQRLSAPPGPLIDEEKTLVELFGRDGRRNITEIAPAARALVLAELVGSAFAVVNLQDDIHHEDSYTPNVRDEAESARSYLLACLKDCPGPIAHDKLVEIANLPVFASMADRLRYMAVEKAAKDSEPPSYSLDAVIRLGADFEIPPHDQASLLRVIMDRLEDIKHDIANDDFSNKAVLKRIDQEIDMQREIARRFREKAKGCYVVSRETEMADRKVNDIQLSLQNSDSTHLIIEIKLADNNYTIKDLENTLSGQIEGQYLRHESCTAGCLLLVYRGEKPSWRHPVSGDAMGFDAVLAHLERFNADLHKKRPTGSIVQIVVIGIDLSDPLTSFGKHRPTKKKPSL